MSVAVEEQERAAEHAAVPTDAATAAPLALRVNFSWAFVGNAVYAACKWGVLAYLAKATTAEGVGQFALGVAVAAPTFMLLDLQLRSVQATDARGAYSFGAYASLRLITAVLGLTVVACIGALSQSFSETALVIALVGLWRALESVSDVIYGDLQRGERLDRVAQSLLIKGPLSLVLMVGALVVTGSVTWAVGGLCLGAGATLVAFDVRSARSAALFRGVKWNVLASLVRLSLPLGIVMMLISLNTNVPRYLVEVEMGTAALGVFSAIVYVVVAGGTVVSALGQAAAPRLSQYAAAGETVKFKRLLGRLVLVGVGLGIGGVVVAAWGGEFLLSVLYTPEYARHSAVFTGVMIVAAVLYIGSFLGYAMTAAGAFKPQLPLFAVTVAVTFLVGVLAIPKWGLLGAVLSMGASAVTQGIGSLFVLWRVLGRPASAPATSSFTSVSEV